MKSRKRLELRLPEDHPIWEIPDGMRNKTAIEWMNIGYRLLNIESKLDEIVKKLETGSEPDEKQQRKGSEFDKNLLLQHFIK